MAGTGDQAPPADQASTSAFVTVAATEERNPYSEFFEDFASSVVTIAYVANRGASTTYGTGFILISEEKYTIIFAINRSLESREKNIRQYHVYFDAEVKIPADVLSCEEFLILLVIDDKARTPVRLSADTVGYEEITTIGAMGGARLHVDAEKIHTLIGILGNYTGNVTTKSCAARDSNGKPLKGTDRYFLVECYALDQIVTVENVDDKENQTAHRIQSAPVFRLTTGEVVGIIYSTSDWGDIKKCLHTKIIRSRLDDLFKTPKDPTWQEGLKRSVEIMLQLRK